MIAGFFDMETNEPVPWVRIFLLLPDHSPDWEPVNFLIDTGAFTTTLHPADALSAGVEANMLTDPRHWPRVERSLGVGGHADTFVTRAQYGFLHEDGTPQIIDGEIRIARLSLTNQQLPSLLGWDVLEHFTIHIDRRSGMVSLE